MPDKGARVLKRYKELKAELNQLLGHPQNETPETIEELAEKFEHFSLKPDITIKKTDINFQKIRDPTEDEEMEDIDEDENDQILREDGALQTDIDKIEEEDENEEEAEEKKEKGISIETLMQYTSSEFATLKKICKRFHAKREKREKTFKNLIDQYQIEQERRTKIPQNSNPQQQTARTDLKMSQLRKLRVDLAILNQEMENLRADLKFSFKTLYGLESDLQIRILTEKMDSLGIRRKKIHENEKKIEIDDEETPKTEEIEQFFKENTLDMKNCPFWTEVYSLPENPFDLSPQKSKEQTAETIILSFEDGVKAEQLDEERMEKVKQMLTAEELASLRLMEMKDLEIERKIKENAEKAELEGTLE